MLKKLSILLLCVLCLGCKKHKDEIFSEKTFSDSLAYYIKIVNDKSKSKDIKIKALVNNNLKETIFIKNLLKNINFII